MKCLVQCLKLEISSKFSDPLGLQVGDLLLLSFTIAIGITLF